MKIARCICPACDQSIELPETDTLTRVECPACQFGFIPEKYVLVEPEPATMPPHSLPKVSAVRGSADTVSLLSKVCFLICLIIAAFSFYIAVSGETVTATPFLVASGFFTLGLWLQVIAQLMFIRAAVEEK